MIGEQEKYSSYSDSGMHKIAETVRNELKKISIPDLKTQTHNDTFAMVLNNKFITLFAELDSFFPVFSDGAVPTLSTLIFNGSVMNIIDIVKVIESIDNLFEIRNKFYCALLEYTNENGKIDIKEFSNSEKIKKLNIESEILETIIKEYSENIKYIETVQDHFPLPELAVQFLSLPKSIIFYQFLDKLNNTIQTVNFDSLMPFYNHSKNFDSILWRFKFLKRMGFLEKFSNLRFTSPNTYSVTKNEDESTYCLPEKYEYLTSEIATILNCYKKIYASELMLEDNLNTNSINLDSLISNIEQPKEIHFNYLSFGEKPMTEHKSQELLDTVSIEFPKFNQDLDFEDLIKEVSSLKEDIILSINKDISRAEFTKIEKDLELLYAFQFLKQEKQELTYVMVEKLLKEIYINKEKIDDEYVNLKLMLFNIKTTVSLGHFMGEVFKEITSEMVGKAIERKKTEFSNTKKKYSQTVYSKPKNKSIDSKETVSDNSSEEDCTLLNDEYLSEFLATVDSTEISLTAINNKVNSYNAKNFFEEDLCQYSVSEIIANINSFFKKYSLVEENDLRPRLNSILELVQQYKDNLIFKTLNGEINSKVKDHVNHYVEKCKSIYARYLGLSADYEHDKSPMAQFEDLKKEINLLNLEISKLQIRLNELQIKVEFVLPSDKSLKDLNAAIVGTQINSYIKEYEDIQSKQKEECLENLLEKVLDLNKKVVDLNSNVDVLNDANLSNSYTILCNSVTTLDKSIVTNKVRLCAQKYQKLRNHFNELQNEYAKTTNAKQVFNSLQKEVDDFKDESDKLFKVINPMIENAPNEFKDIQKLIDEIKKISQIELSKEKLDSLEKDIETDMLKKKRAEALSTILNKLESAISNFMHDKSRNKYVKKVKNAIKSYINDDTDSKDTLDTLVTEGLSKYCNLNLRSCLYQLQADLLDIDYDKSNDINLDKLSNENPLGAKICAIDDGLVTIFDKNPQHLDIFRRYLNDFIRSDNKPEAYETLKNKFIARLHSYDFEMSNQDINWPKRAYTTIILAIFTLGIALGVSYAYTKLTTGKAYLFWEKSAKQKESSTIESLLSDLSQENTLSM